MSVIQTYDTAGFVGSPESQARGKIWSGSCALTARQEGTDPPQAGVRLSSECNRSFVSFVKRNVNYFQ